MTNFERIQQMTEEEFVEWLEDFAEAYVVFWIPSICCQVRKDDKKIQLDMLKSEYIGDKEFKF